MGGCSLLGSRIPSNALPDPERLRRVAGLCSGVDGEDSIVVVVLGRVTGGAASDEPLRRVTTDIARAVVLDEGPLPRLTGTSLGEDLDRSPRGSSGGENPVWFAMVPTQLQVQLFSRYTKSPDHSSAWWQLLRGEERVH